MVTGCLRTISTNNLPVGLLAKNTANLRRKRATIALASHTKKPNNLLHERLYFCLTEQQSH